MKPLKVDQYLGARQTLSPGGLGGGLLAYSPWEILCGIIPSLILEKLRT